MPETLTLRDLNRATLARQLVLVRADLSVSDALGRLIALQAQVPSAPHIALWSRLEGFGRALLTERLLDHSVVKATSLRATLHVLRADDYLHFRTTLAPIFESAMTAITKKRGELVEQDRLLDAVRPFIDKQPRTFVEISAFLAAKWPDHDIGGMRYSVRMLLPMLQVPQSDGWGFPGNPAFALAESWLGRSPEESPDQAGLVRRYLAAFGPATIADAQSWTGLVKLTPVFDAMRDELVVLRDETKRALFDLSDAPRPGGDIEAPVRFLPEFDNLLSGHKDRSRFIAAAQRQRVYLPALRVAPTVLIDGFVAGVWKIETEKKARRLVVELLAAASKATLRAVRQEAERLCCFVEPGSSSCEVDVQPLA